METVSIIDLALFIDEIDCLSNGTLITFLQQLRYGYINRADIPFVHSMALVGMRNIRDYRQGCYVLLPSPAE